MWKSFLFWLDDQRLRLHFRRVERALRSRDVSHLPQHFQSNRAQNLDQLHSYVIRGIFPRNHDHSGWMPYFIDRDGRECAVAHLVIQSGHRETAQHIARTANNAYLLDMNFPELDSWAGESGLTKNELALIQPSYIPPELIGSFASLALWTGIGWTLLLVSGILAFLISVIGIVPIPYVRLRRVAVAVALSFTIVLILIAGSQVWKVLDGFSILSRVSNLQPPMLDAEVTLARAAFPSLILQCVITLIFTLVASALIIRRWRADKKLIQA
jgi:hypothetical protein